MCQAGGPDPAFMLGAAGGHAGRANVWPRSFRPRPRLPARCGPTRRTRVTVRADEAASVKIQVTSCASAYLVTNLTVTVAAVARRGPGPPLRRSDGPAATVTHFGSRSRVRFGVAAWARGPGRRDIFWVEIFLKQGFLPKKTCFLVSNP
jgi:hypothetical protein